MRQSLLGLWQTVSQILLDHNALFSQRNGGGKHIRPVHFARSVSPESQFQTSHGAGHPNRQAAIARFFGVGIALRIEEHITAGTGRSGFAIIDSMGLLVFGQMHQHETASADIAGSWQCHSQCEAYSHCSIHCIATFFENIDTNPAGLRLLGHDHAMCGNDRLLAILIGNNRSNLLGLSR